MSVAVPATPTSSIDRPGWRKFVGFNIITGLILAAVGYVIGWYIGKALTGGSYYDYIRENTQENDLALFLAYAFAVIGFIGGMGFLNYPLARMAGRPASLREKEPTPASGSTSTSRPTTRSSASSTSSASASGSSSAA